MRKTLIMTTVIFTTIAAFVVACDSSAQSTPGNNNEIPEKIMTPDIVETRLGTMRLFAGMPDSATVETAYDNLDFMRGIDVFLNFIPATSVEGTRLGLAELGTAQANQVVLFDNLMDSNPLFLTGNTDTVYAISTFDLERDGPLVLEVPGGSGPGTVNGAFFRFIVDMSAPGPDRGKGGKYLILPPGYDGEIPEGYFVAHSRTYGIWMIHRGFLVDGKPDAAANMYRNGLKIYALASASNPPEMEFISGSKMQFKTIHANTFEFYEELHHIINWGQLL